MANNIAHILDIGSSKLRLAVVQQFKHYTKLLTVVERSYDGFMDGEFFNVDNVAFEIKTLVDEIVERSRINVRKVYVGVPSEFCLCICKRISSAYLKPKKITSIDLQLLFDKAKMLGSDNYGIINFSPMKFCIENKHEIVDAIGVKAQNISMDCSFVLAKNSLQSLVRTALEQSGVRSVMFISSALGQALSVLGLPQLQPIAVLDVGHISTSLSVLKGEGLAMLSSFSIGGGHISADLMQVLKLSYIDADALKKKAILTIRPDGTERYELIDGDKHLSSLIQITNDIIRSRIESIGQLVDNLLSVDDVYKNIPIYITGDGITNIRGAVSILGECTNRTVLSYSDNMEHLSSKYQTAMSGLTKLIKKL